MQEFANWVLEIGEAGVPPFIRPGDTEKNWIQIPQEFLLMPTGPKIPAIIDAVYDSFQHNYASVDYLTLLLMRSMLH